MESVNAWKVIQLQMKLFPCKHFLIIELSFKDVRAKIFQHCFIKLLLQLGYGLLLLEMQKNGVSLTSFQK